MSQKEYTGVGAVKRLANILNSYNPGRIFLVTDEMAYKNCGAKSIIDDISSSDQLDIFYDFSKNPKYEDVVKGIDRFKSSNTDVIVALGGGSVIDMAKLVNILASQKGNHEKYIKNPALITTRGKPLVAIPTTTGSGSEATHFAVVYVNGVKHSVAHPYILPTAIILDAELTMSLPATVTATSGLDALCQAIEAHWSVNSTEKSRQYSGEAITLAVNNLKEAVSKPSLGSRANMSKAALLAGKAINVTKTTAPHALSYTLTSDYNVPHGQAVAITLPEFMIYNFGVTGKDNNDSRGENYVKKTINEIARLLGGNNVHEARNILRELITAVGLKIKLRDLFTIKDDNIQHIAQSVNTERLKNNPRRVTTDTIIKILESIR